MDGIILRSDDGQGVFLESSAYLSLVGLLGRAGLVGGATLRGLERGGEVVLRTREVARIKGFLARVVMPNLGRDRRLELRGDGSVALRPGDAGLHAEHIVTLVRFLRRARGGVRVARRDSGQTATLDPYRPWSARWLTTRASWRSGTRWSGSGGHAATVGH